MNRILINTPSRIIRENARSYLNGYWKITVLGLFIYYAVSRIPVILFENVFHKQPVDPGEVLDISKNYDVEMMGPGSTIYTFVIMGVFTLGITMMFLGLVRGRKVQSSDVFDGFEYVFKALGLYFMMNLFILLWSLLFIVPGIIAAIRYSQAFYILADHPDFTIMDCINESKRRMTGNKMKYFCLSLSFIGWLILAAIPEGILSGTFSYLGMTEPLLYSVFSFILLIPGLWVYSYMQSAYAVFYELLMGKTMVDIEVDADFVVMD